MKLDKSIKFLLENIKPQDVKLVACDREAVITKADSDLIISRVCSLEQADEHFPIVVDTLNELGFKIKEIIGFSQWTKDD
jgi:hypothetical protein